MFYASRREVELGRVQVEGIVSGATGRVTNGK